MATRRNFTDQFKAKIALEDLRGDKTIQEIAAKTLPLAGISCGNGTFQKRATR
jgi:hypothetical protein